MISLFSDLKQKKCLSKARWCVPHKGIPFPIWSLPLSSIPRIWAAWISSLCLISQTAHLEPYFFKILNLNSSWWGLVLVVVVLIFSLFCWSWNGGSNFFTRWCDSPNSPNLIWKISSSSLQSVIQPIFKHLVSIFFLEVLQRPEYQAFLHFL